MGGHPSRERMKSLIEAVTPACRDLLRHVSWCPDCGELFAEMARSDGDQTRPMDSAVLQWEDRAPAGTADSTLATEAPDEEPAEVEELEALDLLAELQLLAEGGVDLSVGEGPSVGWSLAERILTESRNRRHADPKRAERLALLALKVADRLDVTLFGPKLVMDLRARAWTYVSFARRLASDLNGAEEACERAWACLERGTGDILDRAVLLENHGLLLRDQRRFSGAVERLRASIHLFLLVGDKQAAGRALMNLAASLRQAGDSDEARSTLRRAAEMIDPGLDAKLGLALRHNLIAYLVDVGEYEEASAMLEDCEELYDTSSDTNIDLRRRWVQAQIARGKGRLEEAETGFLEAREGFLKLGIGYDAALVSLELATLYAEQRRFSEMRRLADEMLPVFRSQDIHREALAALAVFQQAARVEGVTLKLAREITDYLGRARFHPDLRFERAD